MPTLLTVEQMRDHVETDLIDDALSRVMDGQEADIISKLGALATETKIFPAELFRQPVEQIDPIGSGDRNILLGRTAVSITSITERFGEADTVLDPTDFKLFSDGFRIERLSTGPNPNSRWRGRVTVVYVPNDETAKRTQLLIDLVKLAVNFEGLASQKGGAVSKTYFQNYQEQRSMLFQPFTWSGGRLPLA